MNTEYLTYIVTPILSAMIGGVAWYTKHFIEKRDEAQNKVFEQRDKDKAEMKKDISDLKKDVNNMIGIVLSCDKPDCPSKKLLGEYIANKKTED